MTSCKFCGSSRLTKKGTLGSGKARYRCKDCGKWGNLGEVYRHRSARILLLDIETLPGEYYAFDPKVDYLSADKQIKDWSISCWAAKWLFEPEIMGEVVSPQEAFDRKETSILGGIWKLMDEAHIVVTQNGINFDIKKLNSKFIENGYAPPSKYLNVDTLKVAQGVFGFSYNNLNELGKKAGIPTGKIRMSFDDWKNCLTNDKSAKQALEHKLEYCKNDVAPLLEDVYLWELPWMPNHPNLNLFTLHDEQVCPKCESSELTWNLTYTTPQGLWKGFRCQCGAIGRGSSYKEHRLKATSIQ
jgi:hypothetical protein